MTFDRIFLVVLDGVGIGEAPDADVYGDIGSFTLGNIANIVGGLQLPNLEAAGLGNIAPLNGLKSIDQPIACFGKLQEQSKGKDTTTGHWEIAGIVLDTPFPTFPNGFPNELIEKFKNATGYDVIGNKPASGVGIIEELGEDHVQSGKLIVYTSADSVLQIAAHVDIVPIDEQYRICEIARKICDDYQIGRVISRPFSGPIIGNVENFIRTNQRKDFSVLPTAPSILDSLKERNYDVIGVGKIADIFANQGITQSYPTKNNADGIGKIVHLLDSDFKGLAFINLIDFDMHYGHRNDPIGFHNALIEFDLALPGIVSKLTKTDVLIITADHGNDPTTPGTDHSREYTPLLVFQKDIRGKSLGVRQSFSDIAQTIAQNFKFNFPTGNSFLSEL